MCRALWVALACAAAAPCVAGFTPAARYGHCTFVTGGKMYALGGAPFQTQNLSNELMVFDPADRSWALLNDAATGTAPPGIEGHACTPHSTLPLVYVTGGNLAKAGVTNRTWMLDLSDATSPKWTRGPELTTAVRRHTAVLSGLELILMGGSRGPSCQENLTDAVLIATITGSGLSGFSETPTTGTGPAPRMGHIAVLQQPQSSQLMYVIAGQTSNNCSADGFQNDVHVLDLQTRTWSVVTCAGKAPRRRYGPTGWWNAARNGVQITGGTCGAACGACGHANDTFLLRLSASKPPVGTWEPTNTRGQGPPPRDRHCSVLLKPDEVLDWGGFVDSHTVPPQWPTDVYALSLGGTAQWTDLSKRRPAGL
jgi:hypothetical protein